MPIFQAGLDTTDESETLHVNSILIWVHLGALLPFLFSLPHPHCHTHIFQKEPCFSPHHLATPRQLLAQMPVQEPTFKIHHFSLSHPVPEQQAPSVHHYSSTLSFLRLLTELDPRRQLPCLASIQPLGFTRRKIFFSHKLLEVTPVPFSHRSARFSQMFSVYVSAIPC